MRVLFLHSDYIEYEVKEKALKGPAQRAGARGRRGGRRGGGGGRLRGREGGGEASVGLVRPRPRRGAIPARDRGRQGLRLRLQGSREPQALRLVRDGEDPRGERGAAPRPPDAGPRTRRLR